LIEFFGLGRAPVNQSKSQDWSHQNYSLNNKLKFAYNDTHDENEVDEVVREACKDTPELLLDAATKQSRDESMI